ncbi:uncharacterized protein BT62DRAFT_199340 [Guyanagaster necrorhizus]|uniref:Uncharacterized protein n=1 Tax=Guyanagaster necrorhizus TaxID=856835 RepID=A0A9P7VQH1_9AGAR|nr:uncharacterized protein BT62DRAFT_199340 [Guyanagaster necrorhizus MCA 3950]KAG7444932.1 hypothetical protein BT62DRAFT_199340 [Guyanagaster necrorhizus MCA 3950]
MPDVPSKTLFLFLLIFVPIRGAPAPQATDIGSFDSLLQDISSSLLTPSTDAATSTVTFTDMSSISSGDSAYVTRVSLVGGTEITLAPSGATGDTTILGSSTYTFAAPSSSDPITSSDSSSTQSSSTNSVSSIRLAVLRRQQSQVPHHRPRPAALVPSILHHRQVANPRRQAGRLPPALVRHLLTPASLFVTLRYHPLLVSLQHC